jgi:hypothetical protein
MPRAAPTQSAHCESAAQSIAAVPSTALPDAAEGGLSTQAIYTLLQMHVAAAGDCAAARAAAGAALVAYINSPEALEILGRQSIAPRKWVPRRNLGGRGVPVQAADLMGMTRPLAARRMSAWFR